MTEQTFTTAADGTAKLAAKLPAGLYRAVVETKDRFGKPVTARSMVEVVDPAAKTYGVKVPNHFTASAWSVVPGEAFTALWGTGYGSGRGFVVIESDGKRLQSYWT